jgi:HlyD family secretion protein
VTTSARSKVGSVLPFIVLLLIIAAIAGGLWLISRPPPGQLQGMIDTDEIRVAAKAPGRVAEIKVREGDTVHAGQVLFALTNEELDARLAESRAGEVAAKAMQAKARNGAQREDIASARSAWLASQAQADVAAKTATRVSALYAEGVVSAQKRDEALAAARATAEASAAARAQYDKAVAGTRVEDREVAGAQVGVAAAAVGAVSAMTKELSAVAPMNGQVSKRFANVGEVVPPGFPVLSLIDPSDVWVSVNVREDQFSGLKIDRILTGKVPALDMKALQFKVYYIAPQGDFATWRATRQSSGYDIKTFEIRARPETSESGLRPGMSVLFDWPQRL